jgi:hypothetical protein
MSRLIVIVILTGLFVIGLPSCTTREVVGGAAVGGAAYEFANKRAIDQLEEDYREGRIDNSEYKQRRKRIEERSLVY